MRRKEERGPRSRLKKKIEVELASEKLRGQEMSLNVTENERTLEAERSIDQWATETSKQVVKVFKAFEEYSDVMTTFSQKAFDFTLDIGFYVVIAVLLLLPRDGSLLLGQG